MGIECSTASDSTLKDFPLFKSGRYDNTANTANTAQDLTSRFCRGVMKSEVRKTEDLSTGQGRRRHWIFCRPIDIDATHARKIGSCGTDATRRLRGRARRLTSLPHQQSLNKLKLNKLGITNLLWPWQ
jgi:hypothetical protein